MFYLNSEKLGPSRDMENQIPARVLMNYI